MLRRLICSLLLVAGLSEVAGAQAPKYFIGPAQLSGHAAGTFLLVNPSPGAGDTIGTKLQLIYLPADFPAAPAGNMTNVYFRSLGFTDTSTVVYRDFRVKIGPTERSRFNGNGKADTFLTSLTSVFIGNPWIIPNADSSYGKWLKIPLSQGQFRYSKTNFAVEISWGAPTPHHINISGTTRPHNGAALSGAINDKIIAAKNNAGNIVIADFGFDLATTGVDNVTNITSIGLFPNPATGGRFQLSFDTKEAVREASVIVTDAAGREAYRKAYLGVGTSFFKEVDMRGAAKGLYFVEVQADGERITRRVMIE